MVSGMQVKLSNETKKLAVIGDPVSHSMSPFLHNAMARMLDLNYIYLPYRIENGKTGAWIEAVRELDISGFNATMPHKTALLGYMDELSAEAKLFGAVNTVVQKNGRLYGHNTDGIGFARWLEDSGYTFKNAVVAVLGAGGAAKAISIKAAQEGACKVLVLNRTVEKAEQLAQFSPRIQAYELSYERLSDAARQSDILINCIPAQKDDPLGNYDFLENIKSGAAVLDILYDPPKTRFLQKAESRGLFAANGLGMLIYQAIFAFEIFTGVSIEIKQMAQKLFELIENA